MSAAEVSSMYAELPDDIRARHPYHMYDEIKAQPEAVARSLSLLDEVVERAVRPISAARRIYLTGCGTSWHAAQVGGWMLRAFSRGALDVHAVQAYELATYAPELSKQDVVVGITHSGVTAMTLRALERAGNVGAARVAITGFPDSRVREHADALLPTGYNDERSWAHTVSYTAALATMAGLANRLAVPAERLDLSPLADVMRAALELEEMAHRLAGSAVLAAQQGGAPPVVLVGGGPNAVTAYEGTLKLLETSYVAAAGWELEQVLHGPLAAVRPDTLMIIIAPAGPSTERAVQLMQALEQIGVVPVVLAGEGNAKRFGSAHRLVLADVPEVLSPLPCVVPLQLFSYFLAVGHGLNPDLIHRDEEPYRLAAAQY
jgi:glucosamine--fructose-6-phosphate aminotransferase (isomerizing)